MLNQNIMILFNYQSGTVFNLSDKLKKKILVSTIVIFLSKALGIISMWSLKNYCICATKPNQTVHNPTTLSPEDLGVL